MHLRLPTFVLLPMIATVGLPQPLFIGSASTEAPGLYVTSFDAATGVLSTPRRLTDVQPYFFRLSPDGRRLHATGHEGDTATPSVLRTYTVDPSDHALTLIATQPLAGRVPLHFSMSPDQRFAAIAHYQTPTVVTVPLVRGGEAPWTLTDTETLTGSSIFPARQDHAYPHSVNFSPDGRYVYVCDRGADRIAAFAYEAGKGTLTALARPIVTRPGTGPRHLAWHPDGNRAYVINEISGSLTAYAYDPATGNLTEGASYPTVGGDFTGENLSAEVVVHPNGRFVYASNRGPDTLAVFAIGDGDRLDSVQSISTGGAHPRYFVIDPTGRWLLVSNRHSDSITVFALDPSTGRLTATGSSLPLPTPLGLVFPTP